MAQTTTVHVKRTGRTFSIFIHRIGYAPVLAEGGFFERDYANDAADAWRVSRAVLTPDSVDPSTQDAFYGRRVR